MVKEPSDDASARVPLRRALPRVLHVRDMPGYRDRRPTILPTAVYIGRFNRTYGLAASMWGNPFTAGRHGTRDEVIAKYRAWLSGQTKLLERLSELHGYDLVCWCAPELCHGHVLLKLANPPQSGDLVSGARHGF